MGRKTAQALEQLGAAAISCPKLCGRQLDRSLPGIGLGAQDAVAKGAPVAAPCWDAFGEAGVRVVEVAAYESGCPDSMPEPTATALDEGSVDAIAFSSGKTAEHQLSCWNNALARLARTHGGGE